MPWTKETLTALFEKPFFDLLHQAHSVHRQNFPPRQIQFCALINIKTGGCPEDCSFCNQSAHFKTGLQKKDILPLETVIDQAKKLKEIGVERCCLGAAWRRPPKKDFPKVLEMVKELKALGFETCVTLGFLEEIQASALKKAGLDYYNHNIETSQNFYSSVVSTHTFEDRVETICTAAKEGLHICCGGIFGLGESREDRIHFFLNLSQLKKPPRTIPINRMIRFSKTPLEEVEILDKFEFIRTIAVARLVFPDAVIRLSGGRKELSEAEHALCFYAGASSIFVGDVLLTASNKTIEDDLSLLRKIDLSPVVPTYLSQPLA